MFAENWHERIFLEALVKYYNAKKKNSDNRSYTNTKKIPWEPNIGPKIRKEFKKVNKDITFTSDKNLQSIYVKTNRSYYHAGVMLECTSWIVHAMANILVNQRNQYWHVALKINQTALKVTGNHPAPLNTPKSAMDNSTGFTREQSL